MPNIIDRNWQRTTNGLQKCSRSGTNGDRRDKTAFRIDSLRLPNYSPLKPLKVSKPSFT